MFTTEKNIPYIGGKPGITAYLKTLAVDDSFEIDSVDAKNFSQLGKQIGITLKSKKTGNKIRVWRTA